MLKFDFKLLEIHLDIRDNECCLGSHGQPQLNESKTDASIVVVDGESNQGKGWLNDATMPPGQALCVGLMAVSAALIGAAFLSTLHLL